jgi:molybdopterin-guanine dinucleotide biosynthesis protein A
MMNLLTRKERIMNELPPKQEQVVFVTTHETISKPYILFMDRNILHKMQKSLAKKNSTLEEFINSACMDYLDNEQQEQENNLGYTYFSEMQLFPTKPKDILPRPEWSYHLDDKEGS